MRIMQALWEEFSFTSYVIEDRDGTSFATLREQADIADSGNFNYHLGELVDLLIEDREDGYVLTPLGYNLMGSLDRYTNFEYETLDEWEVEDPCPFCRGQLVARYRREILEVNCRDCGALADDGNFTFVELASTGVSDLDRHELLDAAVLTMGAKIQSSMHGICWDCHASMDLEFDICEQHTQDVNGICPHCLRRYQAAVNVSCSVCGTGGHGPILEYAIYSPVVSGFFNNAGHGPSQIGQWQYRLTALRCVTETCIESTPARAEVEFTVDENNLCVTIEKQSSRVMVTDNSLRL